MGITSGSEREEILSGGASEPPDAAPKMLINSVSGEVMVTPFGLRMPTRPGKSANYLPVTVTLVRLELGFTACGTSILKKPLR